ncbi:aspartate dehydrogenase [Ferrovibrio sp.]|uniref:aspartate dehydrogenase n=1 Tax=Ferrovibrio sp. TaxID=1917215 RepID=UPI001B6872ED|nr:aspartate dehydrogenase [Ferrovibrio sp.]MBP7064852.1 aspartate dehydrogenase [Ferrovibrio sp.]
MSKSRALPVGLIGYGAIGRVVAESIAAEADITLVGVLLRPGSARDVPANLPVAGDAAALLALGPRVVVEAAGHAGLHAHAEALLRGGVDLLVASVGALADAALESRLRAAADAGGGRVLIPAGALGGLDALGAARHAGLDSVEYTGRKAPKAWIGTKAESLIDLGAVTEPAVFFEGTAREAALAFPQNANVVAAVALAGLGFEQTRVRLMVDPTEACNQHSVLAHGPFGEMSSHVVARVLPANPKTSMLAPYSLVRGLRNLVDVIAV